MLDFPEPSSERRDRGQTEESWLLFEGIDTFLYGLMRKSKIEIIENETDPNSQEMRTGAGNHEEVLRAKNRYLECAHQAGG